MDAYVTGVMNTVSKIEKKFEDFAPYKFPKNILNYDNKAVDPLMFDMLLYSIAKPWRDSVEKNYSSGKEVEKDDGKAYWVPFVTPTKTYIIDKRTNKVRSIFHREQPEGMSLLSYIKDIPHHFGRGELRDGNRDYSDGSLYRGYN